MQAKKKSLKLHFCKILRPFKNSIVFQLEDAIAESRSTIHLRVLFFFVLNRYTILYRSENSI